MTTAVQRRRGTATEHSSFTGLEGELSVNTTNESVHVHDGSTAGGFELARADASNIVATSIDINGGSIDGTTIGASTAAAGTFTTGDFSGLVQFNGTAGIQLDNAAQVHTWALDDNFTSRLNIGTSSASAAWKIGSNNTAYLTVSPTGIDVTGTVTADGLTVSNSSLQVKLEEADGTYNPRLVTYFDSSGTHLQHTWSSGAANLIFEAGGSEGSGTERMRINGDTGDISFYEDTGTTAKLFWDASAESLGIGTSSPASLLHIENSAGGSGGYAKFTDVTHGGDVRFGMADGVDNNAVSGAFSNNDYLFYTNSLERMRIDSSGNVGINTSSPAQALHVNGRIRVSTDGSNGGDLGVDASGLAFSTIGSTQPILFERNNYTAESMRIDSSGNVGIGTTSPSEKLQVEGTVSATGMKIGANGTDINSTFLGASSLIAFKCNGTERARIDSSGHLLVGTTSSTPTGGGFTFRSGTVGHFRTSHASGTASGNWYQAFYLGASVIGTITQAGTTGVNYNTSSDQRLKENIADADDAGSKIDAIQVRKFDWKADGSHQDYGMIAQELQTVAPEAVTVPTDSEEMMGVDYSKLVPMLIKEIQSLRNRVAQLEE